MVHACTCELIIFISTFKDYTLKLMSVAKLHKLSTKEEIILGVIRA